MTQLIKIGILIGWIVGAIVNLKGLEWFLSGVVGGIVAAAIGVIVDRIING
jgi:hypothetical protein